MFAIEVVVPPSPATKTLTKAFIKRSQRNVKNNREYRTALINPMYAFTLSIMMPVMDCFRVYDHELIIKHKN
jgi:hypothetical protein